MLVWRLVLACALACGRLGLAEQGSGAGTPSAEAQEGTAAHIVGAGCLNRDQDAWEWMGQKITVQRAQ